MRFYQLHVDCARKCVFLQSSIRAHHKMNNLHTLVVLSAVTALALAHVAKRQAPADYPTYAQVPDGLSFTCENQLPGYYADVDTQCQVWHWCSTQGTQYSFLCPNQTVFNQNYRVCDWWYNVDCPSSTSLYGNNEELYKDADGNAI